MWILLNQEDRLYNSLRCFPLNKDFTKIRSKHNIVLFGGKTAGQQQLGSRARNGWGFFLFPMSTSGQPMSAGLTTIFHSQLLLSRYQTFNVWEVFLSFKFRQHHHHHHYYHHNLIKSSCHRRRWHEDG